MNKSVAPCVTVSYPMSVDDTSEDIKEYIRRILEEKELSEPQVEKNTRNRIKQSAINALKNGRVDGENASIYTLYWLSRGLQEDPVKVFSIALKMSLQDLGLIAENDKYIERMKFYFTQLSDNRKADLLDIAKIYFEKQLTVRDEEKLKTGKKLEAGKKADEPPPITLEEAIADNKRKTGGKNKK